MISVMIVDDEPMARARLRRLVEKETDLTLVGEHGRGADAVAAIRKARPDVVLLDVDMPDMNGFEVIEALDPEERPLVVFVTAYDAFAVRAFDVHALDYWLKPYDPERFASALDRVRERLARAAGGGGGGAGGSAAAASADRGALEAMLAEVRARGPERIVVREGQEMVFVPVKDIDWIEAADNYVELHVAGRSHLLRETLAGVERRLSPARFARIRRDAIVNLERVRSVRPGDGGDDEIVLHDGRTLRLGRSYRAKITERWQE
jgi:two-component system LytT family response regulator